MRAILLRVGFTRARVTAMLRELLPHDFTLARTNASGMFLWHFPSSFPDRTLSCTLPYEARTFLTHEWARSSGAFPHAQYTIDGGALACPVETSSGWTNPRSTRPNDVELGRALSCIRLKKRKQYLAPKMRQCRRQSESN